MSEQIDERELDGFAVSVIKIAESKYIPDCREKAESTAGDRNGLSRVPADPIERLAWVKRQAVKMGYADANGREPGCDDE